MLVGQQSPPGQIAHSGGNNLFAMADRVFGLELVTSQGQNYTPLNYVDLYEVLENLLRVQPEDLGTIQMQSPDPKRIDITTKSLEVWARKDIFKYLERKFNLTSGKVARIVRPFDKVEVIRVKRVPSGWNEDD